MKKITFMKKAALLLAAAMLFPMFAAGCESAQNIIKQRERADEVSKLAEAYMQEKYNRGFKVSKCEAAAGDEYEGDFFISFNGGVHAFYDTDDDLFFDDRQSDSINELIMREIWRPLFESLKVPYDNINDQTQTFNMVYRVERGGKVTKYSMYHDNYEVTPQYFAVRSNLSVTTDNIIFVTENRGECKTVFEKISETIGTYFKGQAKGEMNVYAVSNDLHSKLDFDAESIDETTEGVVAHLYFGNRKYCAYTGFSKVTEGLYGNICHLSEMILNDGDIILTPVDDFETVKKNIVENMDSKEIGILDKYTGKKRDIDFGDAIYKVEITSRLNQSNWENITLAFVMKDSDAPIENYAEINEQERSFFGYNMNGTEFNATCLCSQNSRSVMFKYKVGDEVYFWFGSQK